jgi:hypothetical protein
MQHDFRRYSVAIATNGPRWHPAILGGDYFPCNIRFLGEEIQQQTILLGQILVSTHLRLAERLPVGTGSDRYDEPCARSSPECVIRGIRGRVSNPGNGASVQRPRRGGSLSSNRRAKSLRAVCFSRRARNRSVRPAGRGSNLPLLAGANNRDGPESRITWPAVSA